MTDRFLRTLDDIKEEQDALTERQLDPDMALASDFVTGALPEHEAARVRERIARDRDFADLVEPLIEAYEQRRPGAVVTRAEQQRKYLELRRRVGLPEIDAGDAAAERFAKEIEAERRRARRNRRLAIAASVLILIVPAALYQGMQLYRAGVLSNRAPWGTTQRVPLLGGSTVELASGTRLEKLRDFGEANRTVILTGEASFDVAKSDLPPVVVRTQSAEITVTGTRFRVHAYEWEPTVVSVEEGTVLVRARNADGEPFGPALAVGAGQRARAIKGYQPERLP